MGVFISLSRQTNATGSVIYPDRFQSDIALLTALKARDPGATAELFDRYGRHVRRVLARVMGSDPELTDLVQEVFLRALGKVHTVRDGNKLKGWLSSVAVFTARGTIRSRQRFRWLGFRPPEQLPDPGSVNADPVILEALRRMYAVLNKLPVDERIAFALRNIDQMELTEVAKACGVSLATIKRRLNKAEHRFVRLAQDEDALQTWIERHPRWSSY